MSENLQLDESLTLEKAIEKITQAERVKSQNTEICENDTLHIDRAKVPHKSGFKNFKKNNYLKKCFRCGDKKAHQRKDCPANDEKCRKCNILRHNAEQRLKTNEGK